MAKQNIIRKSSKTNCCRITKPKFLIAAAGCSDDNAAVASLPDVIVPRRSGPILATYVKTRETNHEEVLKLLAVEARKVNDNVDAEIKQISENLLENIKLNQSAIDSVILEQHTEEENLSKESYDKAINIVNDLLQARKTEIEYFKQEALKLEKKRASALQFLLREKFEQLIIIGHVSPKNLLHDFDTRIYEINQQLLSNARAYTELEASLHFQADENKLRTKTTLSLLRIGITFVPRKRSAALFTAEKMIVQGRPNSAVERKSITSVQSTCRIFDSIDIFDQCVSRMVQVYKTALMHVFVGFSRKLEDLEQYISTHQVILDKDYVTETLDTQGLVKRTLRHLSSGIFKKYEHNDEFNQFTETDFMKMQKSLISLGNCLHDTYTILNDAGHLWDAHIIRSAIAQKLTIVAVEDFLTSHDILELSNEVTFNINLEQLRCAPDPEKLQLLYNIQLTILDRMAETYRQHSESEVNRLEEFLNLQPHLSQCLRIEYNFFLHKYLGSDYKGIINPDQTPNSVNYRVDAEIPRTILQNELNEISLRNWKNGFLETFKTSVDLIPDELKLQALLWVRERAAVLQMRCSVKDRLHSIRLERVTAARDTRSAELSFHQERLNSHLDAITRLIETLPAMAAECYTIDSPELYPLHKYISKMHVDLDDLLTKDSVDTEVKKLKIKSYSARLTNYQVNFQQSLEDAMEMKRISFERNVQEVRIANVRFMSGIKLFHEGGRYAVAEATKTCNALVKASDGLEICSNRTKEIINLRRMQLLSLAEQNVSQLRKVFDEVLKTNGKSAMDKRKAVGPKK